MWQSRGCLKLNYGGCPKRKAAALDANRTKQSRSSRPGYRAGVHRLHSLSLCTPESSISQRTKSLTRRQYLRLQLLIQPRHANQPGLLASDPSMWSLRYAYGRPNCLSCLEEHATLPAVPHRGHQARPSFPQLAVHLCFSSLGHSNFPLSADAMSRSLTRIISDLNAFPSQTSSRPGTTTRPWRMVRAESAFTTNQALFTYYFGFWRL